MKFILIFSGIVVGAILVLFFLITSIDYLALKKACETWRIESERPSKFVSDYPWYHDCLTKTKSGWISATHLYQQETPDLK